VTPATGIGYQKWLPDHTTSIVAQTEPALNQFG